MQVPSLTDTDYNLRQCLLLKADDLFFTLSDPLGGEMRERFLGIPVEGLADENLSEDDIGSIDLNRFDIAQRVRALHAMLQRRQLSLDETHIPHTEKAYNEALHFLEYFLSSLPNVALGGNDLTAAGYAEVRKISDLSLAWLSLIEFIECAFSSDDGAMLTVNDVATLSGIDVRTLRNLCGPEKTIRTSAVEEPKRKSQDATVFVHLNAFDVLNWLRSRRDFSIAAIDAEWIKSKLTISSRAEASRGLLISAIVNFGPLEEIARIIGTTPLAARACVDGPLELPAEVFAKLVHYLTVDPTDIIKGTDTMDFTSNLGRQTAELHNLLRSHPQVQEHPKGHSKYVLRYQTDGGHEIAIEKRVGVPLLYFTRKLADACLGGFDLEYVAAGKEGRNSNLNTLDTFRAKPLARMRVTELETARKALAACVSS